MKRLCLVLVFGFLVMLVMPVQVQSESIKFKGLVQTWLSYAEEGSGEDSGYGFTLRRIRFKPYGSFSEKIKWTLQVGWDKQSAKLFDAYIDFIFSKGFKLRIGQYTVPGTISSSLTSSAKLDFVERAAITQKWGSNNDLSGYRALGIQAFGDVMDGKLYYAVMLSNPRTTALFNPSIKSSGYDNDNNGLVFWGRVEAKLVKGLRIGTFYTGGKETDTELEKNSYGAHLFYVKNGLNLKAEYIAGEYGVGDIKTKYNGLYALAGYKTGKWEPILRYDFYTPNDDQSDSAGVKKYNNISLGINYYYTKKVKFQANYLVRTESMVDGFDEIKNNLFYVCFQYTY
ncbi:MAG: hypothetical protein GY950_20370 [bacterium]|nr:hypothetical protein [bacterium]